jgi:hypothetical protein
MAARSIGVPNQLMYGVCFHHRSPEQHNISQAVNISRERDTAEVTQESWWHHIDSQERTVAENQEKERGEDKNVLLLRRIIKKSNMFNGTYPDLRPTLCSTYNAFYLRISFHSIEKTFSRPFRMTHTPLLNKHIWLIKLLRTWHTALIYIMIQNLLSNFVIPCLVK